MKENELTENIIGSAFAVLNQLNPGLDENLYERALGVELGSQGIEINAQTEFPVYYKNTYIGKLIPDMLVANQIIVETKVVSGINESHIAQVLGYLNITGLKIGLILNFKYSKLQIKRVIL